ncbi:DUF1697 domain-containing protein [Leptospira ilyithenensis]|uniref:DUF1697 domain-containing protein n=1 Tax=Leptospira ilyithenensis TaxID=2484901 RepID=A0A4R9LTF1_9LEPT|nr:DUF1697 domain-containing protein [Leptospira ilyithenensis]TGN13385.1 DUF1697 domain-containing protein [Leptospira ilyithenensis]
MKYIALLRGINVGGNRKVEMKKLRNLFESLGYINVSTYINSGNVIFESEYIDVRYIKGAIYWNVKRENIYKSHLAKVISHKFYKSMTIRNVNTARFLAGNKK